MHNSLARFLSCALPERSHVQAGGLSVGFNANTNNFAMHAAAIQSDGRVLLAGRFMRLNGTTRSGLAGLNARLLPRLSGTLHR
jgi:hypothetical protein